jgi:hypothetical protein
MAHVVLLREMINVFNILFEKLEGKRQIRRPRLGWDDGMKINIREIRFRLWIGVMWLRVGTSGRLL